MSVGKIVSDTGPIFHLHESGALEVLRLLGSILMPPEVELELDGLISGWSKARPRWIEILELESAFCDQAAFWTVSGFLHKGESQALALALQLKSDWFLTDDTSARVLAESMRVETHGSLGVVLWAAAHGHMGEAEGLVRLEALFESSLWVSPKIQEEARAALHRICSLP